MATLYGSLDNSHSPFVTIAVSAPSGPSHFMDALIDTGFTGFVHLGLTPGAVAEVEYADGRTGTIPLAWARVSLGRDAREELIHIQRGNEEVIVGVELLRIFRKILVLSIADRLVMLVDTFDDLPSR